MLRSLKARIAGLNRLFLVTVALPTLLAIVYFGLIASDVYISESRFVVRSPERQSASPLGSILQGVGFTRAQDDAYSVHDFILSRDALRELETRLSLGESFAGGHVDALSRFGAFDGDRSFESLYKYYMRKVEVQHESASSISTLTVRAFSAEQAREINEQLLGMSEALVNRLNERGRRDMIRFAMSEVATAEKRAKDAAVAVSSYRNQKGVIDPERQATFQLQQLSKLQDELIAAKTQLAQLLAFTPDNPQVPAMKKRVQTLQAEIDGELGKVTGGERSLANKATDFQRLALEREFADKQLASAMSFLEQARNEAQRQQLYLERIVQPNLPDSPLEPRRLRAVLVTFVFGLIVWGVLSLLVSSIREHAD